MEGQYKEPSEVWEWLFCVTSDDVFLYKLFQMAISMTSQPQDTDPNSKTRRQLIMYEKTFIISWISESYKDQWQNPTLISVDVQEQMCSTSW